MKPIHWTIDDHAFVRTLEPDDAEELFAVVDANRDRLRPWMPWEPTTRSAVDIRAFIDRCRSETALRLEGNGVWVDGALGGSIGLRIDDEDSKGEIGYWIGGRFEGRGIVTRACRLFIDHGFRRLGLHRISIHAAVSNARSRAVAERLGFRQEGIERGAERVADGYHDLAVYGMLADEWPTG